MKKVAIGIWCAAGGALLADIHGKPLLQLTADRAHIGGAEFRLLIPWTPSLDHLEHEVKSWRPLYPSMRCHPDKRIAMRDLVASLGADIGIIVDGSCAWIDKAELHLAVARLSLTWEEYKSDRVHGRIAETWLQAADDDEWPAAMDAEALRSFYATVSFRNEARTLKARRASRGAAEEA